MIHDPLLQLEHTRPVHIKKSFMFRACKFLSLYLILTASIFAILMGMLNFSAYSAMVTNWVNPDLMLTKQDSIEEALMHSSVTVHAADLSDSQNSLQTIISQIEIIDPDIIYSRTYNSDRLLSGISRAPSEANFAITPYENRIVIPKLGKNIPLVDVTHDSKAEYSEMQDVFMEELKKGIVRYPGTARPGEVGNTFIFGHSSNYPWIMSDYNDVFALLGTLSLGDEIIVYYEQKKYVYKMTDKAIVNPGDTEILSNRDPKKKEISLMTCWPIGTTLERYIVFGELVEN